MCIPKLPLGETMHISHFTPHSSHIHNKARSRFYQLSKVILEIMTLIHPRYVPRDPTEAQHIASSVQVIRTSDNASFLASKIPNVVTKDAKKQTTTTRLASAILPTAAVPISLILNHPNIISLVDIIQTSNLPGPTSEAGPFGDITIWEDMDAGSLAYLLPTPESHPDFRDEKGWHLLAAQNFHRFSLPESLCWHVLRSISRALLWLHHGVKETEGIRGEWLRHDNDWHTILIRDLGPSQIWFKKPKGNETYGECKLGGFQWAKVCGSVGGVVASTQRKEDASREKMFYWPPVSLVHYIVCYMC